MLNGDLFKGSRNRLQVPLSRHSIIGLVLAIALISFELFNFDTTKYALTNLLGGVNFLGIGWATILAIAFCAIDFAGLAHLLTPEQGKDEPKEVWYLMGAWLLGATMNAVMTWWAVSLTLLEHNFGNEVLSREQLLRGVPIFVAALVWLTRILFIGALSVASDNVFYGQTRPSVPERPAVNRPNRPASAQARPQGNYNAAPVRAAQAPRPRQRPPLPPQRPVSAAEGMRAYERQR